MNALAKIGTPSRFGYLGSPMPKGRFSLDPPTNAVPRRSPIRGSLMRWPIAIFLMLHAVLVGAGAALPLAQLLVFPEPGLSIGVAINLVLLAFAARWRRVGSSPRLA